MGELIGYARVSSRGQDLTIQTDALTVAGVHSDHLYQEKVSGTKRQGRAALDDLLLRGIRKSDTNFYLFVTVCCYLLLCDTILYNFL